MSAELTVKKISQKIYFIRSCRVMLDADLAQLYEVETKNLNKAVRRNLNRFPEDFMFQITERECEALRFQLGTSKIDQKFDPRGGRRYMPLVFTEHGVAMLSGILKSQRAVLVNIEIMRTFGQLREFLLSNRELAQKPATLEKKYDSQFKIVFDAIRELMTPPEIPKRKIGIKPD
jgi:ORF6N domain